MLYEPDSSRRPAGRKKQRHKLMLIEATADVIAAHGIANCSITRIIQRAELSRGMVHLHFHNKEELLIAVAEHMSQHYFKQLARFTDPVEADPAALLEAVVTADLSPDILNMRSANIWFAFRGEARAHNAFRSYSDTRDDGLRRMILKAYRELARDDAGRDLLARDATHGTLALLEGMWADFFLHSDAFDRAAARRIVLRFMNGMFPGAFGEAETRAD